MRAPILAVLAVLAVGCGGGSSPNGDAAVAAQDGACIQLEDIPFSSRDELACGPGGFKCHWTVRLSAFDATASSYEWRIDDQIDNGKARCTGPDLETIEGAFKGRHGHFDSATGELTLDGVIYVRAN